MSERYRKVFSLPENLYSKTSPVVIQAGALLLDTEKQRLLGQLKFQSICDKTIIYLKVNLIPRDAMERKIGEPIEKEYLDLQIQRDATFGTQSPIIIPMSTVRAFLPYVTEVGFSDHTVWTSSETEWQKIPTQQTLDEWLTEKNQIEEFQRKFGDKCANVPLTYEDIWICSCGKINFLESDQCVECGASLSQMAKMDPETLNKDNIYYQASKVSIQDTENISEIEYALNLLEEIPGWKDADEQILVCRQRIEELKIKEEEERLVREREAEIRTKKAIKAAKIGIPSLTAITLVLVLTFTLIIPMIQMNKADQLLAEGKSFEAAQIYQELGGYKDSAEKTEKIKNCIIEQACELAKEEKYQEAYNLLIKFEVTSDDLPELEIYQAYANREYTTLVYRLGVTDIVIPNGVTSIGDDAFSGCSSLTSITIPDSVTSIGDDAFSGCSSLTSITIPDSVTSIGSSAFSGCSSLTSITIPDSVTSIGEYAFDDCRNIKTATIPSIAISSIITYNLQTVVITSGSSIGSSAFSGCSSLTSIMIPDSVTSIGSSAFSGCSSLTSITIPDSVTSIGSYAFYGCRNLTNVTLPDSITLLGRYSFMNCNNLKSITLPNHIQVIGEYTFNGCRNLKSVTIPNSVIRIDGFSFADCGLTDVYFSGTQAEWNLIEKHTAVFIPLKIHFNYVPSES